ncbi:uncharacterized protein EHS24_004795 [Apiotrichum porosum]|uniref:Thioredoxin domain-containing protein n=1 Tax=Apiotrichum porosum TaxID=105984 RepID=A0A427Y616_9TREE|nr:uncharacterized protein EHS24_004795 [Apiotrichum porosum]RSH86528.1 hypothetical protein EHS24_004795 [Apiotrichum porosum]
MVKVIESAEEFNALISGPEPVVVDYWATWCGPCKLIGPHFAKLEAKYPGVTFAKVDIEEVPRMGLGLPWEPDYLGTGTTFRAGTSGEGELESHSGVGGPSHGTLYPSWPNTHDHERSPGLCVWHLHMRARLDPPPAAIRAWCQPRDVTDGLATLATGQWTHPNPHTTAHVTVPAILPVEPNLVLEAELRLSFPWNPILCWRQSVTLLRARFVVPRHEVAQEQGIKSMPTFKAYKNGAVIEEFSGAVPAKLTALLDKVSAQ